MAAFAWDNASDTPSAQRIDSVVGRAPAGVELGRTK